jgi:hypothetical protein
MQPSTKLQVFANFLPQQYYNPLSPQYSPALSPLEYFLFPKLKMKFKGLHSVDVAEIQEAVTYGLNVQKEEFLAAFQKLRPHKSLYIHQWSLY